uniref:Uncharacterized protein n=1 Tax=Romanomermis culicivorax TaxID=13658 RepID=A0A915JPN6_ROMCU
MNTKCYTERPLQKQLKSRKTTKIVFYRSETSPRTTSTDYVQRIRPLRRLWRRRRRRRHFHELKIKLWRAGPKHVTEAFLVKKIEFFSSRNPALRTGKIGDNRRNKNRSRIFQYPILLFQKGSHNLNVEQPTSYPLKSLPIRKSCSSFTFQQSLWCKISGEAFSGLRVKSCAHRYLSLGTGFLLRLLVDDAALPLPPLDVDGHERSTRGVIDLCLAGLAVADAGFETLRLCWRLHSRSPKFRFPGVRCIKITSDKLKVKKPANSTRERCIKN